MPTIENPDTGLFATAPAILGGAIQFSPPTGEANQQWLIPDLVGVTSIQSAGPGPFAWVPGAAVAGANVVTNLAAFNWFITPVAGGGNTIRTNNAAALFWGAPVAGEGVPLVPAANAAQFIFA
ncbi:uncharacterized protein LACBIDRAFT_298566 [Laccaria bicolor S238N-H82]|uniref:Predicted protein n=1 Tax=Laccaria bicolor (strain S238N-H82 / ATCC MYA-4686) TaxID=486041 RepID=B0DD44_LACBS|nr:uncharacterized protein LACBIDRAFT_298566 [Laccaria bicolor S238N-H82]EDR07409.1 predicted protein [Laccaria bicolor S238N-H82]|eukprot:XP_001881801.1 predicted protein [Laccaria bicolor S238N-H82]